MKKNVNLQMKIRTVSQIPKRYPPSLTANLSPLKYFGSVLFFFMHMLRLNTATV